METYILGEIKSFSGTRAPEGWLLCDGATLDIAKHDALFSLLSTKYGGDGIKTFCLPDLRGRIPLGQNTTHPVGEKSGSEFVNLRVEELPAHNHNVSCSTSSTATSPHAAAAVWASTSKFGFGYGTTTPTLHLNSESIGIEGNDEAHENRMPFTAVTYMICNYGIYPTEG